MTGVQTCALPIFIATLNAVLLVVADKIQAAVKAETKGHIDSIPATCPDLGEMVPILTRLCHACPTYRQSLGGFVPLLRYC